MNDITINDSSLNVASRLTAARRNTSEPVPPDFLPGLVPGVHLYLGNLPKELCHVYLEVVKITDEYDTVSSDAEAMKLASDRIELARKMFCASLRKYFRQYADESSRKEFVICVNFKVGLQENTDDEERQATEHFLTSPKPVIARNMAAGRFVQDMM